jgi:aminoglycoside phosphotransferase (APT) family kinase protein
MTPPAALPNPESCWERAPALASVDRAEIERRIGPFDGPVTVLAGGLANVNLRIGDRVLRLYRRDPGAAACEAALLARGWTAFRVPKVLQAGDDFLVIEYVELGPVLGTREHGLAVGRALAEIHSVAFESSGLLDASLRIQRPFPDIVSALVVHARSRLRPERCGLSREICAEALQFLDGHSPALRAAAGAAVLLHGDFKPSNLHWTRGGELLVLDWEFAYAGSALSDIGQILRWAPPEAFVNGFAEAYGADGGRLVAGWRRWAAVFDLVNLAGLLAKVDASEAEARRASRVTDVRRRVEETLGLGA